MSGHSKSAIFFDLDDTLIKWEEIHKKVLFDAAKGTFGGYGHDQSELMGVLAKASVAAVADMNLGTLVMGQLPRRLMDAMSDFGIRLADAEDFVSDYIEGFLALLSPYPDCEVLWDLKGKHTLGVITNGPGEWQVRKLERTGLAACFDVIVCSSDYGICKPDPRLFRIAGDLAGCPPSSCTMIGNNPEKDARGAIAEGWRGIHIDRPGGVQRADSCIEGPPIPVIGDLYGLLELLDGVRCD